MLPRSSPAQRSPGRVLDFGPLSLLAKGKPAPNTAMNLPNQSAVEFEIETYVEQMAQLLDLALPEAVRPQVVKNFAQVQAIAQPVLDFPLPDHIEPAPIFQP